MSSLRVLQKINLHSTLSKLLSRTLRVSGKDFKTRWISSLYSFSFSPQLELVQKNQPISWTVSKSYAKKAKEKTGNKSKHPLPDPSEVEGIFDVDSLEGELQLIVNNLKHDYVHKLSLKTSAAAFDSIEVLTKHGTFPLKQIAQTALKSPQLLVINSGKNAQYVKDITKAISTSGMNVNPQIEGSIIAIPLPKITTEHRQKLVKSAKTLKDKAKGDLQKVRQKYHKLIAQAKDEFSSDLCFGAENLLQDRLDHFSADVEQTFEVKKNELMNS